MGRTLTAAALLFLAITALGQDEPEAPAGPITRIVTVVSGEPASPMPGVAVEAWVRDGWVLPPVAPIRLTTAADGTVRFEGVPRRNVVFVARKPGHQCGWHEPGRWYWSAPEEGDDPDGDGVTQFTLVLAPGSELGGRVLTSGGAPLEGATVRAMATTDGATDQWYIAGAPLWTTVTDEEGGFDVREHWADAEQGLVIAQVTASAPDHIRETVNIAAADVGKQPPLTFRLRPAGTIRGTVSDAAGEPVPFASVHAYPPGHWAFATRRDGRRDTRDTHPREMHTLTDAHGSYTLPETPPGVRYHVYAEHVQPDPEEYFDSDSFIGETTLARSLVAHDVSVRQPGDVSTRHLSLRTLGSLTVRVAADAGGSAEDLHFDLRAPEDTRPWFDDEDDGGVLAVGRADPGDWTIDVDATGWRARTLVVPVVAGETSDLSIRLERGASIQGVVVNDAGEPVAGAQLRGWTLDPGRPGEHFDDVESAESDDAGRFTIRGLRPGPADLSAYHDTLREDAGVRIDAPAENVRVVLHAPAAVHFRVTPQGDAPRQARVTVTRLAGAGRGTQRQETITAQAGVFSIDDLLPGPVSFAVETKGHAPFITRLELAPGGRVEPKPFALSIGITLHGRILDGAGKPVVGAEVMAWGNAENAVRSGADGAFAVPHLGPGHVELSVRAPGMAEIMPRVPVKDGAEPIELALRPGGLVRGTVTSREFGPRESEIDFFPADATDDNVSRWRAKSNREGVFSIRLPAGRYDCEKTRVGGTPGRFEFDVAEGGAIHLDLLEP